MRRTTLTISFGLFLAGGTVHADGLLDFLDPCIAAKEDFAQRREAILQKVNANVQAADIDNAVAPDSFRAAWWDEKRKVLRPYYDEKIGPLVKQAGGDPDKGFELWIQTTIINEAGGEKGVTELINKNWRNIIREQAERVKGTTEKRLEEQRTMLYGDCPQDVGSQVFRGTITIVSAPVGIIGQNIEAAKQESGDVAAAIRATTGISIKDIQEEGLLGGDSEARKACDAVAGLIGGRC